MDYDIFEVRCDCGWKGNFNELKGEYEICCPTVFCIKCPSSLCGHEFIQINESGLLDSGCVNIELESGVFLLVSVSGNDDEYRAIPRLSEKDRTKLKIWRHFIVKEGVK